MFLVDTVDLYTLFDFICIYTTKQPWASRQDMQRGLWPQRLKLVIFREKRVRLQALQVGDDLFWSLYSGLKVQFSFLCMIFQFEIPKKIMWCLSCNTSEWGLEDNIVGVDASEYSWSKCILIRLDLI